MKKEEVLAGCAGCKEGDNAYCLNLQKTGRGPAFCPSLRAKKLTAEVLEKTLAGEKEFSRHAAAVEGGSCPKHGGRASQPLKPRIVEIVEFARRMSYRRLGLIFCTGLKREAGVVEEILKTNGFEVVSVCCKVGRIPKSTLGVTREEHTDPFCPEEAMCNPMLQAALANEQHVDFNVLLGLCVGHDSLVFKYLEAPATVLASKDRCLGHSPLQAIYLYDSYYSYLKQPLP